MSAKIGSLNVDATVETTTFEQGLGRMRSALGSTDAQVRALAQSMTGNFDRAAAIAHADSLKMNASLESINTGMKRVREAATVFAEAFAIREIAEGVKSSLEFAASMKKQADVIGITAEQLQLYHLAGQRVGATQEDVDGGLKKLTVSMGKAELGAKKQQDAFNALGVDYRKTAGEAIPQLADALSKVGDDSKRHALEVLTMGRAAVQLDPLFKQGAEGIAKFKDEAEKAGLILSNEFTEQAHEADVKLDELVTTLKIDFSKEVIQNANAIIVLANALAHLTSAAVNYINNYPRLSGALAGAYLGARVGGVPGAIIGAGAGAIAGERLREAEDKANPDLKFRLSRLNEVRGAYNKFVQQGGDKSHPAEFAAVVAAMKDETDLTRRATAAFRIAHAPQIKPTDDIPDFLAGKGPKPNKKHVKKDALQDADLRFIEEQSQIDEQILQVKRSGLTNLDDIAAIDIELLAKESIAKDAAIQKEVRDKHLTEIQGDKLIQDEAILIAAKAEALSRHLTVEKLQDQFKLWAAENDNQREILQLQEQMAVTQEERRKIQLQILASEKEAARRAAEFVLNNPDASPNDKTIARGTLNNLNSVYDLKSQGVINSTRSPLDQYLADNDPKLIGEKVQRAYVDELEAVKHGIDDAITNALGINDPFLKSIIDLFIQQVLIDPIAQALQSHMGSGGGFFGSLISGAAGLFGGGLNVGAAVGGVSSTLDAIPIISAFASGTNSAPGGLSWVGERGPELMNVPKGAQIFPSNISAMMARNDNHGHPITINLTMVGTGNERADRQTANQAASILRQQIGRSARMGH